MWNNRKEEYIFRREQEKRIALYRQSGMTEVQIQVIEAPEEKAFVEHRKALRAGYEEVPLMTTDEKNFEHEIDPMAMSYEDEICSNPFEYGFNDPRLNKMWVNADEIDQKILRLLSEGLNQSEIELLTEIPQQTISYRVERFRKKYF